MGNYGNSITVTIINASKKVEHLETSEWYTLKSATNRILQLIFLENEALKKKNVIFSFRHILPHTIHRPIACTRISETPCISYLRQRTQPTINEQIKPHMYQISTNLSPYFILPLNHR